MLQAPILIMPSRNATKKEIEEEQALQKMRNTLRENSRRSGKTAKQEGKVSEAKSKSVPIKRSQKKFTGRGGKDR